MAVAPAADAAAQKQAAAPKNKATPKKKQKLSASASSVKVPTIATAANTGDDGGDGGGHELSSGASAMSIDRPNASKRRTTGSCFSKRQRQMATQRQLEPPSVVDCSPNQNYGCHQRQHSRWWQHSSWRRH